MDMINFGQFVVILVIGVIAGYLISEWLYEKYDGRKK